MNPFEDVPPLADNDTDGSFVVATSDDDDISLYDDTSLFAKENVLSDEVLTSLFTSEVPKDGDGR